MFEARRNEIRTRLAEIRAALESGTNSDGSPVDMDALENEIKDLNEELRSLDRREAAIAGFSGSSGSSPINNPLAGGESVSGDDSGITEAESRAEARNAILGSKEYRKAFAKALMGKALSSADRDVITRALDTAVTTTSTTFTAPTAGADGVNNGGLFIPTNINLSLMESISLVSPIFRDLRKMSLPGVQKFPYRDTITAPKNRKETEPSKDLSIKWVELSLALSEIAATIPVTFRLETMAVEQFLGYLEEELKDGISDKLIGETIYGTGAGVGGADDQLSGITGSAVSYTYSGTALDGIGVALKTKFANKKHKVGAKIYVAQDIVEEISFTKDQQGNYIYSPINSGGINSVATYKVEVDPYLEAGDFIIGNIARFYKLNEYQALAMGYDRSFRNRRTEYTGWGIWAGALQPNTVVYGKKSST